MNPTVFRVGCSKVMNVSHLPRFLGRSALKKLRFFFAKKYTPQNKHGSPENGGPLEKEIPDLETIISRFQPLIFGGVSFRK